jgi:hypothetical protein
LKYGRRHQVEKRGVPLTYLWRTEPLDQRD